MALWAIVAYVGVLLAVVPDTRLAARAWAGCVRVAAVWFLLARTKTLTWAGFARFFCACTAWALVVGLLSLRLSEAVAGGAGADGPGIGIAAVTEEALKLLPVALLVLIAPGRAARFAAADWLLLGLASGTGFMLTEEGLRRLSLEVGGGSGNRLRELWVLIGMSDEIPDGWVRFGGILPSGMEQEGLGSYAGHGVVTAIVTASVGVGIAAWRQLSGVAGRRMVPVKVGAVLLPVAAAWIAVTDHAGYNATLQHAEAWLDGDRSTVPLALRLSWTLFGQGGHRAAIFVGLALLCLVLDAHRLAGVGPRLGRNPSAMARVVGGDVAAVISAHARVGGEPRLAAALRGRASVSMRRSLRELHFDVARGSRPAHRYRAAAAAASSLLVVTAVVVGPRLADHIGPSAVDLYWLAGVLDGLGGWFADLSTGEQILVGAAIAGVVVLSGGSLGLAFGVSGVATYLFAHGTGAADLVRDPAGATRSYISTATPAGVGVDLAEFVLTFAPGNFAGAVTARAARQAATAYASDPAVWRASMRQRLHDDTGSLGGDFAADLRTAEAHLESLSALNDTAPYNVAMVREIHDSLDAARPLTAPQRTFLDHETHEARLVAGGMQQDVAHQRAMERHPPGANYSREIVEEYRMWFGQTILKHWGLG